jgi:hypothetical protein
VSKKPTAILGIVARDPLMFSLLLFFALALFHDPCFSSELFYLEFDERPRSVFALYGLYLSPSRVLFKFFSILSLLLSTEQQVAVPLSVFLVLPFRFRFPFPFLFETNFVFVFFFFLVSSLILLGNVDADREHLTPAKQLRAAPRAAPLEDLAAAAASTPIP